jgi:hypothetical protein
MGADFQYPDRDFELWTPLYIPPNQLRERGDYSYLCVARVKAGVRISFWPGQRTEPRNSRSGHPCARRGHDYDAETDAGDG